MAEQFDRALRMSDGDQGQFVSRCRVADQNGAGIRHEGGRLVVRNCRFTDNEIGILTWGDPRAELIVERSEFDHNAVASGRRRIDPGHQIYVGRIGRFPGER